MALKADNEGEWAIALMISNISKIRRRKSKEKEERKGKEKERAKGEV